MRTEKKSARLRARELMSFPLVTLETSDTMQRAAKALLDNEISGAAVFDHSGRPVGVLSKTDFLRYERIYAAPAQAEWRRLATEHQPIEIAARMASPAREREEDYVLHWMKRGIVSIAPEASVEEAARIMARRAIHRVFVRERGNIIGVITAFDLLAAVGAPGRRSSLARGRRYSSTGARRSATHRKVGGGFTARRNLSRRSAANAPSSLEASATGRPSRKSTRKSAKRFKPSHPLRQAIRRDRFLRREV